MGKRTRTTMALPPGVNWADLEFFDQAPAKKPRKALTPKEEKQAKYWREQSEYRRLTGKRSIPDRKARSRFKKMAKLVIQDLIELRLMANEEAIAKFREQQAREAKQYAAQLAAAFHKAVEKEAAGKTAA